MKKPRNGGATGLLRVRSGDLVTAQLSPGEVISLDNPWNMTISSRLNGQGVVLKAGPNPPPASVCARGWAAADHGPFSLPCTPLLSASKSSTDSSTTKAP